MRVVEITDAEFERDVLHSHDPVLVEFGAPWCGPCVQIRPVLEAIAGDRVGSLRVVTMNVDEQPLTSSAYGVLGLPTMLLFQDGAPILQLTGARPRSALDAELDRVLAARQQPVGSPDPGRPAC